MYAEKLKRRFPRCKCVILCFAAAQTQSRLPRVAIRTAKQGSAKARFYLLVGKPSASANGTCRVAQRHALELQPLMSLGPLIEARERVEAGLQGERARGLQDDRSTSYLFFVYIFDYFC
jgi:hypothetical protein